MNDLAERLRALHHADAPLILPNAWDVASARAVERAGASAIATSSSAVAESLGFEDGEQAPPDEMFAAIQVDNDCANGPNYSSHDRFVYTGCA